MCIDHGFGQCSAGRYRLPLLLLAAESSQGGGRGGGGGGHVFDWLGKYARLSSNTNEIHGIFVPRERSLILKRKFDIKLPV